MYLVDKPTMLGRRFPGWGEYAPPLDDTRALVSARRVSPTCVEGDPDMSPLRCAIPIAAILTLTACGNVKKQFDNWMGSDADEGVDPKKAAPSIVRPDDAQGVVPAADRAVNAAQALHKQLHPGQKGDRVISAIKGDAGTVQVYLEKGGKTTGTVTYWVGRKADGWHAYHKIPKNEDFPFVFKAVAKEYLTTKHPGKVMIHDFWLGEGAAERVIRLRYATTDDVYTKQLSLRKDSIEGWTVVKEEDTDSVYGDR